MGYWANDGYIYTKTELEAIAINYLDIYQSVYNRGEFHGGTVRHPLIDYKSDFDRALNTIGRGEWTGDVLGAIKKIKTFGKLQRIVITQIEWGNDYLVGDLELERIGFYRIPQLRGYAYHLMADRLNGELHHGTKTQFKAKTLDIYANIR